ncbi:MAG: SMP-30/gluconolactonase/LRE family protein, partial [Acidimicrobiia bacterium]
EGEGVPDGMKLDEEGNIYCTGPGGVWICSPTGTVLGRIRTPEVAANLAWGDPDARSMYITASTSLFRIRCQAAGHAPHRRI